MPTTHEPADDAPGAIVVEATYLPSRRRMFWWDRDAVTGAAVDSSADISTGPPFPADATPDAATLDAPDGSPRDVTGRVLEAGEAAEWLATADPDAAGTSDSLRVWILIARAVQTMLARGRFVPVASDGPHPQRVALRWTPVFDAADDRRNRLVLARALPRAGWCATTEGAGEDTTQVGPAGPAAHVGPAGPAGHVGPAGPAAHTVDAFWNDAVDSLVRRAATAAHLPLGWEADFVEALGTPPGIPWDAETATLAGTVVDWLRAPAAPERWLGVARLDAPDTADGPWRLTYAVQSEDDPTIVVDATTVRTAGTTEQRAALAAAVRAARTIGVDGDVVATDDDGTPTAFDLHAAWAFLDTARGGTAVAGVVLDLPPELAPTGSNRLRLRLHAGGDDGRAVGRRGKVRRRGVVDAETADGDGFAPSTLDDLEYPGDGATPAAAAAAGAGTGLLEALAEQPLHWEVTLGENVLDADELDRLLRSGLPLVRVDDAWVRLDPDDLEALQAELAAGPPSLGAGEVVAAVLAGELTLDDARAVDVVASGEVARLVRALRGPELTERPTPEDLDGSLRPYQAAGLDWLLWLSHERLGGCLADDMGLGKTVQTIALLLEDPGTTLVVSPTSVLGNWEREIRRFAPTLRTLRHHGPDRPSSADAFAAALDDRTVVLTTYAILRRDADVLATAGWHRVVLDEAQHVKNPQSDTARAARRLADGAAARLALTGTPVENNLTELWSILDFANPGLLGGQTSFRKRFAVPIERHGDPDALERLRRITAPFVLRRRKSDPSIVADLPEKHETTMLCSLSPQQAALYRAAVDEAMTRIGTASGISRRGLVLALLTRLKQICDHPALVLDDDSVTGTGADVSGKLGAMLELYDDVRGAGDRSLVFTQYRKMGEILADALGGVPFLHGGLRQDKRDEIVQHFQHAPDAPDALVVSLRAGGLGLNLTRANRVFHFDRWWNPAVEDQATDRTHRIGQTRDVWVHKLVCLGTLEERIDTMMRAKRDLADSVIGTGEAWLTELDDDDLAALVALESEAVL